MNKSNVDFYEVLGVQPDASEDEIQAAYRRRAQQTHPDRSGDAGDFRAVQAAYDRLSDPDERAQYDAQRHPRRFGSLTNPELAKLGEDMLATLETALSRMNVEDGELAPKNLRKELHPLLRKLRTRSEAGFLH